LMTEAAPVMSGAEGVAEAPETPEAAGVPAAPGATVPRGTDGTVWKAVVAGMVVLIAAVFVHEHSVSKVTEVKTIVEAGIVVATDE